MNNYVLTVFSNTGEKLLDETFEAENDEAGKTFATKQLKAKDFLDFTHRCVTADARLILFHR